MNATTEQNSTHTPGPWSCEIDGKWFSIWGNHADLIARTPRLTDGGLPYLTGEPDARLIAAAPELANCIHDLLYLHEAHHNHPLHVAARALLAKAEG